MLLNKLSNQPRFVFVKNRIFKFDSCLGVCVYTRIWCRRNACVPVYLKCTKHTSTRKLSIDKFSAPARVKSCPRRAPI